MVCSHWPRGGNREPRTNLSSAKGETCRPIGALRYEVSRVEKGERRKGEGEREREKGRKCKNASFTRRLDSSIPRTYLEPDTGFVEPGRSLENYAI